MDTLTKHWLPINNILTIQQLILRHNQNHKTMSKETYKEAIELFGKTIVNEVMNLVYVSDADGCYTTFQDMGMYEHAECTEFMFFN